jgi:hypothetical protein
VVRLHYGRSKKLVSRNNFSGTTSSASMLQCTPESTQDQHRLQERPLRQEAVGRKAIQLGRVSRKRPGVAEDALLGYVGQTETQGQSVGGVGT